MDIEVRSGRCAACGRPLVFVSGVSELRTYHPAAEYYEYNQDRCPVLKVIPGTESWETPAYSLDVPDSYFIPNEDN